MIRAPSGKDLFKGREVGLMRRTGSRKEIMSVRQDALPGPAGLGLLGRKTSDPKKTRVPEGMSPSVENLLMSRNTKPIYSSFRYSCQATAWEPVLPPRSFNSDPGGTVLWRTKSTFFHSRNAIDKSYSRRTYDWGQSNIRDADGWEDSRVA